MPGQPVPYPDIYVEWTNALMQFMADWHQANGIDACRSPGGKQLFMNRVMDIFGLTRGQAYVVWNRFCEMNDSIKNLVEKWNHVHEDKLNRDKDGSRKHLR